MPADHLSLYIDLQKGEKADLEVASAAAIAFAETVREIAGFIDPFSEIRLELIDTTENSLSFNTKIRFRTASGTVDITVYALLFLLAAYVAHETANFIVEKALTAAWEKVVGPEDTGLNEKSKKEVLDLANKAYEAKVGEQQMQRIFAELSKDPSVSGVGIGRVHGERPAVVVPKSQFAERSGVVLVEEPAKKTRRRKEIKKVILVSPVLSQDRKRRWKFRFGNHEFGAPIRDDYFLDAVFSGKYPLLMQENIVLTVRLETVEKYKDGAWVETDHIVWQVIGAPGRYQGAQNLLPFNDQPQTSSKPNRGK